MICHSIATSNEHKYKQNMEKLGGLVQNDPSNQEALKVLEMYTHSNFMEIREMVAIRGVREFYNRAISYTIEKKRDVLAFDLISFSQEMNFHLVIHSSDMDRLIQNQLYAVIEQLIFSHCEFKMKLSQLDRDELL